MLRALRYRSEEFVGDGTSWLASMFPGLALGIAAPNLTDITALSVPAFWKGVRLKSDVISTLPLGMVDGTEFVPEIELPNIIRQPDPDEDLIVTLARLVSSVMLRGNGFMLLDAFDDFGFPNVGKVVHPDQVGWQLTSDSRRFTYVVGGTAWPRERILHVRGLCLPGEPFGVSVLGAFARTLDSNIRMEDFQRAFYRDNATPSALISIDRAREDIDWNEIDAMKTRWMANARGSREPMAVPADIDFKPLQLSNADSQFLESRQFSLIEMANITGVPKTYLGADTAGLQYNSPELARRDLLDIALRWELVALERAFSALVPPGLKAKFDLDDMLRADEKTRAETTDTQRSWKTMREIRRREGLPDIPGDEVIAAQYVQPDQPGQGDDPTQVKLIADTIQSIFPSVEGFVLSPEEARTLLNRMGAGLTGPPPTGGEAPDGETSAPVTDPAVQARAIAELIQKIYLGVGVVLSAEEAREIANRAGAGLTGTPDLGGRGGARAPAPPAPPADDDADPEEEASDE